MGLYQRFMKQHEKQIVEEKLIKVPAALDLTPYRDEKDFGLLQRLVRREKSKYLRPRGGNYASFLVIALSCVLPRVGIRQS